LINLPQDFQAHLDTGITHLCRCWAVERKDGLLLGFTDHDLELVFEGMTFSPSSGLTAKALEQTTGLSVDNSEAMGILSAAAVTEADIEAGRYDGAEVRSWLVNWSDVSQRILQFRGTLGEIRRAGGAFQAELRGLTEALNQVQGRRFQQPCSAVLGDKSCGFDLDTPGYSVELPVEAIKDGKFLEFSALGEFEDRWFERGRYVVKSGEAIGLIGLVKNDKLLNGTRTIELWETVRATVLTGDLIRFEAGCNRRPRTCRLKFNNFVNFQGFPTIPGEDWLMSAPHRDGQNDGGSLYR